MRKILQFAAVAAATAALVMGITRVAESQADIVIQQRQPAVCNPQGTTKYLYYNVVDGKWHCTATAMKVVLGGDTTTPVATELGGLTDPTSTTSGTVQNTEYTLNSVTIPANAFNATGRGIRCDAWGNTAANVNAKNIKFYVGASAVVTVTGTTASGKDYQAELTMIRSGASTQSAHAQIQVDTAQAPAMAQSTTVGQTDTAPILITIKSANTAAAAASATGNGMICSFIN